MVKSRNQKGSQAASQNSSPAKRSTKAWVIFWVLRLSVVFCGLLQLIQGDFWNAFLCLLSLVLFFLPSLVEHKLNVTLPSVLEIIICLFIFSAIILGEISNFYEKLPYWDIILHTVSGFLSAAIGFSLATILNDISKKSHFSPFYLCLAAFCFSMTVGVIWEFFEFSYDSIMAKDMQKDTIIQTISTVTLDPEHQNRAVVVDNIAKTVMYDEAGEQLAVIEGGYLDVGIRDTMSDLFVNLIGAGVFSVLVFIYLKTEKRGRILMHFIPQRKE